MSGICRLRVSSASSTGRRSPEVRDELPPAVETTRRRHQGALPSTHRGFPDVITVDVGDTATSRCFGRTASSSHVPRPRLNADPRPPSTSR
jgi:hypothetical protein